MIARDTLQKALALARQGNSQEALRVLDAGLQRAEATQEHDSVGLLARNAAIVADEAGNLEKAEIYYRSALGVDDRDLHAHFGMGDVLRRQGKHELAREHFSRCFDLATAAGNSSVLELLGAAGFRKSD